MNNGTLITNNAKSQMELGNWKVKMSDKLRTFDYGL